MPLVYRSAEVAEAEAVLEFWSRAAEDADRPPDSADAVRRLITRDPAALILALHNNPGDKDGARIVGTIIAGWDGWRCHLYRLAVDPAHRRQGLGRELIACAEALLKSYGGTRADAMVLDTNTDAHPSWKSAGYTPQSTWSRWTHPL
ncbi:GNAT family N-acetyltransferase [Kribbella sp. NBC_01245]|uniref:GNAT family N-acetyltransferase n=1 Tax=Kribbella sp. NBC_01245 TaxID=2903578 RepID=UPI002E2DA26C|nr:GNAT family N-acetyltransferase [Kribbella sp. NBC_01245]